MELNDKIVIYRSEDGETQLEVRIDQDTVWLNAYQIAELFGRDSKTIRKHIANAIKEELAGEVVVANFATTTEHGAIEGKSQTHDVRFYNLDVIISVGYRVKSKKGVDFRRWANSILKNYLVNGYAVNKTLTEQHYTELKQLISVLGRTIKTQEALTSKDALNLVEVVSDYAYALDTLDRYDYQQLAVEQTTNEAMLLYLVTKNHSFSDGNKRIAATLFLWFMAGNGILYNPDGSKRIADNTLVALTLMIAESRTEEKDVMVKVVVSLINKNNYE